jgi:hypothetical protein
LTGAVASQIVTEALKGSLSMVGNHASSAKAKGSLTVRHTGQADTKVGLSDPALVMKYGKMPLYDSWASSYAYKNEDLIARSISEM